MNALEWLFGVRWNRKAVEAERDRLLQKEMQTAEAKANDAYEEAMKRIADVPEEDRISATAIADELLVHLAAIEMERGHASAMIQAEYGSLIKKMERQSKSFIGRWLAGRGRDED